MEIALFFLTGKSATRYPAYVPNTTRVEQRSIRAFLARKSRVIEKNVVTAQASGNKPLCRVVLG